MEKIAIDLLWLRPGKVGGTEAYIRNLLDGFSHLKEDFLFTLLVSKDNSRTFEKYAEDSRFELLIANVKSANIAKRIIWQNLFQNRLLRKHGFKKCFEPVYCKPWLNGEIDYICVVHDLQAYHYPQYHPIHEVVYSKLCWKMDAQNAAGMIAISEWVKEDIMQKYHRTDIEVIYNPIMINKNQITDFEAIKKKYGVEEKSFFYAVAQMIPHKNLGTLIKIIDKLAKEDHELPSKLLISGVNGNAAKDLQKEIQERQLQNHVFLTGFVSDEERNTLYANCYAFLFPSIFEGFGMPPVEAMMFGTRTITTRCTSIPEVTQGKAEYVEDPYSVDEWIEKMKQKENHSAEMDFSQYDPEYISKKYLEILQNPVWRKSKNQEITV